MSNRKIKLFLGAYVNSTNAQNLNCLAIAKYIDKQKFDVKSMVLYSGNLSNLDMPGVRLIKTNKPHKFFKYLSYFLGVFWCDIAYLPKGEIVSWNFFLLKLFSKKSISTVEGILDEKNLESSLSIHGDYESFVSHYNKFDKLYSITQYLKSYNFKHHGISSEEQVLYLGMDLIPFLNTEKQIISLNNIIYIGRLIERKGIFDVLELAKKFRNIKFHIVGDGADKEELITKIDQEKLDNIIFHGIIDHNSLANLLKTVDLHVLPSRSEGFPKVTLETAAAGVPSLVYSDYGANEWISHNHNGFVVETLQQMIETMQELIEKPELLQLNSKNAIELAKQFDWKIVIKQWEQEVLKLYSK
nr:glycosyltransferase family 4 protein [uncultured Psychroserpens sp.]